MTAAHEPTTRLRDLHRAIFPTARPHGSGTLDGRSGEREVTWVRVLKARVPAFDALDPSDLAIIPAAALAVVAPRLAETEELAAALARTGVPAVLLIEGEHAGDAAALDALAAAAERSELTVLRLPRTDPVALERRVIGFLVNRRAELDHRAGELEAELARLALAGRGLDALAAGIGSFLGRAVVIEGRRGEPIAVHAPADVPEAASAVSAYLSRPSGVALRLPIPGEAGDPEAGGRLVLLGDHAVGELERIATERIVALLALELARDAAVRRAREDTRRSAPLPEDGPPWVVLVARQGVAAQTGGGRASADTGRSDAGDDRDAREQVRRDLERMLPARRLALRGTAESIELRLVAAAPPDDPDGIGIAAPIASYLGRTVAVSRPFDDPGARPAAEAAARATLEAAEALTDPPPVARAARLPAYLLLGNVHNLPDGARQARDLLAPLLTGRPTTQDDRLATLRAVLESGSLGEAAARLGVHRNTLAYRLARLEELGGWDLTDPDLRFALALAARIVQSAHT